MVVFFYLFASCITSAAVFRDEDLGDVVQIPRKRHNVLIGACRRKDCLVSSTSLRHLAEACLPNASNLDP